MTRCLRIIGKFWDHIMLNKQINREKSEFSFHILLHISWFIYMYISHKICIYWFSNLNKIWIFYLSIRRHLVQRMSNDVVPANQTAQISLHRNRNSINNHKNLNIEQNRELLKTFTSADKSTREKYKKKYPTPNQWIYSIYPFAF